MSNCCSNSDSRSAWNRTNTLHLIPPPHTHTHTHTHAHTQGSPSISSTKSRMGQYLTNDMQLALLERKVSFPSVWVSCAGRMVQARYEEKGPKKWRKRIGKNMVSTNCKTTVKTNVVVFMFTTTWISKLIYTESFKTRLTFNHAKKVFFIRHAQVKVGLINLCKGLFSLNARIYYKLKSGTQTISV